MFYKQTKMLYVYDFWIHLLFTLKPLYHKHQTLSSAASFFFCSTKTTKKNRLTWPHQAPPTMVADWPRSPPMVDTRTSQQSNNIIIYYFIIPALMMTIHIICERGRPFSFRVQVQLVDFSCWTLDSFNWWN